MLRMVILSDNLLIDAFDGVRGGTDHAVVEGKPQAVHGGQMCINDFGVGCVGLAKRGEQTFCLRCEIVLFSNGEETLMQKLLKRWVKNLMLLEKELDKLRPRH